MVKGTKHLRNEEYFLRGEMGEDTSKTFEQ